MSLSSVGASVVVITDEIDTDDLLDIFAAPLHSFLSVVKRALKSWRPLARREGAISCVDRPGEGTTLHSIREVHREDWEVGRVALSCHLSMDLLCQELITVFRVPEKFSSGSVVDGL